jgi:hypothetical protein
MPRSPLWARISARTSSPVAPPTSTASDAAPTSMTRAASAASVPVISPSAAENCAASSGYVAR